MQINRFLGATALVGSLCLAANAASAQNTGATSASAQQGTNPDASAEPAPLGSDSVAKPADEGDLNSNDVIVTGSRIRRPNLESAIPITSVSGQRFLETGGSSVGDTLNDLPQLRSTFAQQNPGLGVGIAGLNLLDLRGLGTQRTLVLVNGRRHVASDILNNGVSVDVNTIPTDLIDRVDVVTGGNSAVYGSDAIAGVVNFVLKRDFDGLQLRAKTGVSEAGFGANQLVSALVGKNFGEGRGNITLSGEFSHQDRVFASDIPWYRSQDGFFVTDVDPAGLAGGSDSFPDRQYMRDVRSASISRFGLVPINQPAGNPRCGVGLAQTNGQPGSTPTAGITTAGTPYSCTYIFTPEGRLVPQTGTRFGAGPNATVIGGNGQTGREDRLLSVYPYQERYNFNLLGHYAFTPAVEAFVEAKWARVNTLGSAAGPSFIQGTYSQFDYRERMRLDNPFLNPADRTTLANAILASGCNTSLTVTCGTRSFSSAANGVAGGALSAADITAINNGSYRFVDSRQIADAGVRDEYFQRDTLRVVGGLRGTFNGDWSYEVSGNYGRFTQTTTTYGYVNKQRFLLSLDAGRNPVTGQIQCRSQFDAASAVSYPNTAANQGRLAADVAACVPYNPFGAADNSAAANYFTYNSVDHARIEQFVATGFVSGDTSGFFNLPGGPLRFAVGGEYRSEKSAYIQDPFAADPAAYTNALTGLGYAPPAFKVKEGYAELELPILKDVPFFQELTLNGAARISDYNNSAGTVWTYNYGGQWAPVRDIRFRANYGRAVRAPNVSETAGALTPNFAPSFADPCRSNSIGSGSQYRAANCQADLGALLNDPAFASQGTYSLPVVSGSNPNLEAEKSDSWTIGTVIQPRFVRNLSISVDYYNIRVNGVIQSVTAQQIANSCYDLPTLDNPFCALFTRYRGTGAGSLGETPGQILGNSLIQAPLNYASRVRKGIDTQVSYRGDLGGEVSFASNLIYTHNFKISDYTNPQDPNYENVLLTELGNPQDEFQLDTDLTIGQVTFGYRAHLIGPMYLNTYEDFNAVGGRAAENADYADVAKYPTITYHDIRFEWNLKNEGGFGRDFQFYGGIDNVFNQHPPFGSTGTGSGSSIYDIRGRNFYAGFRARF